MVICLAIYWITPWIRWDRGPYAPDQAVLVDLAHRRLVAQADDPVALEHQGKRGKVFRAAALALGAPFPVEPVARAHASSRGAAVFMPSKRA